MDIGLVQGLLANVNGCKMDGLVMLHIQLKKYGTNETTLVGENKCENKSLEEKMIYFMEKVCININKGGEWFNGTETTGKCKWSQGGLLCVATYTVKKEST